MEPDTAVMEPETGEATEALEETPDPDEEAPPENEETPESTETEEPKSYTQEDVDKLLKEREARAQESLRQKTEAAQKTALEEAQLTNYTNTIQQARATLTRTAYSEIAEAGQLYADSVIQALKDGKEPRDRDFPQFSQQWIAYMGQKFVDAGFGHTFAAFDEGFENFLRETSPDWKPDRDLSRKKQMAIASRQPNNIARAQYEYMKAAVRSDPVFLEEVEKQVMEKLAADGKVSNILEADGTRKTTTPRPARQTGTPGRSASASEVISSNAPLSDKIAAWERENGMKWQS